jgi:hypothetical protein
MPAQRVALTSSPRNARESNATITGIEATIRLARSAEMKRSP